MLSVTVNTTYTLRTASPEQRGQILELWLRQMGVDHMHEEFPRSLLKIAQDPGAVVAVSGKLWFSETLASEAPVRAAAMKAWVPWLTEWVKDRVQKKRRETERMKERQSLLSMLFMDISIPTALCERIIIPAVWMKSVHDDLTDILSCCFWSNRALICRWPGWADL